MPKRGFRKPENIRRTKRIECRLTPDEYEIVQASADLCGLTVSAFVRAVCLGTKVPVKKGRENSELVRHLSKIGNNLNQLAHQANRMEVPYADDVQHALDELLAAIRQIA